MTYAIDKDYSLGNMMVFGARCLHLFHMVVTTISIVFDLEVPLGKCNSSLPIKIRKIYWAT